MADDDWWDSNRARVFISCGQARVSERQVAEEIRAKLDKRGYSAYVAVQAHSSLGLTENVYRRLTTAEYLLFIDFKRECLPRRRGDPVLGRRTHRGSLFSNQELAIASYLRTDLLPFLQKGVRREGILDFIQGNPVEFEGSPDLLKAIDEEIAKAGWDPNHRRELQIEVWPTPATPAGINSPWPNTLPSGVYRFFELGLRNVHRIVMGTDCTVQVVDVRGPSYPVGVSRDLIELKFKHMTNPSIVLPAGAARQLDGVLVLLNGNAPFALPGILNLGHIDSEDVVRQYVMRSPGDHEIDLQVHSREFGTQKATVLFHFDSDPAKCRLSIKGRKSGPPPTAPAAAASPVLISQVPAPVLPSLPPESGMAPMQHTPGTITGRFPEGDHT